MHAELGATCCALRSARGRRQRGRLSIIAFLSPITEDSATLCSHHAAGTKRTLLHSGRLAAASTALRPL